MKYILPILEELAATTSRTEKDSILAKHADNVVLKAFFEASRNPFRTYNIKIIPDYTCANEHMGIPLMKAINSLYIFEDRVLTGNAATEKLVSILSSLSQDDANVFERIIRKDPDCGIGVSTCNKAWPNLIPTTVYQGATSMSDQALDKLDWVNGVYAQNKEDGLFNFMMCKDANTAKSFGRSGKEYDFKGAFDYIARSFPQCRIDGEIRVWNADFTEFMPRKSSNGYVNKFQVGKKAPNVDVNRLCYIIWDVIPFAHAIKGYSDIPYSIRLSHCMTAIKQVREDNAERMLSIRTRPEIRLVHTELVYSRTHAQDMFKRVKSAGEEGLICKEMNAPWGDGKPSYQVKLKNETDAEMKIIGFQEHSKKKGFLGAFILSSADGKIVTNCGSGLTDELKEHYWNIKDTLLGRVVSVKFESIIWKEKEPLLSLNLPIFLELREDKDVADTLEQFIEAWQGTTGCIVDSEISDRLNS